MVWTPRWRRSGGQVIRFLHGHLGHEMLPSALLGPIGNRFFREVKAFAAEPRPGLLEALGQGYSQSQ
jgi:hypothetical protein